MAERIPRQFVVPAGEFSGGDGVLVLPHRALPASGRVAGTGSAVK
ncbi:hypothetical protein ABR737_36580 [Streptomyces sp. Edi2]